MRREVNPNVTDSGIGEEGEVGSEKALVVQCRRLLVDVRAGGQPRPDLAVSRIHQNAHAGQYARL